MKPSYASVALFIAFLSFVHAEWQPLWPEGAPGAPDPAVVEEEGRGGRLTDTGVPAYWYYPADPAKRNGAAVVIFPGGGYSILAMNHEGHDYAQWLSERGIAAVLVKYRVSRRDEAGFQYPAPYLDARQAIRLTREKAGEWGIDREKIGVMGSSAGGHLASMCVTLFNETYELEGENPRPHCRPNFGILVYPVIGMDRPWGHGGSRRRLLGPENPDELAGELATYRRVSR
ncbi:MAG TPA: alpha/beta hydrolase, partial [Opitutales bacterium]|nr:alpha/beta hydrolase [Opitutales bacterium]